MGGAVGWSQTLGESGLNFVGDRRVFEEKNIIKTKIAMYR